uniref:Uncharacterized protein n=1 Tax=Arundo donax TaxID=35708 RepID=A0A0A9DNL8_ARUDO
MVAAHVYYHFSLSDFSLIYVSASPRIMPRWCEGNGSCLGGVKGIGRLASPYHLNNHSYLLNSFIYIVV